ncbi:hypothetical protein AFUB_081410 [Aspergillus fumigatus A1163]|uniref:Uncharacterized protein n=1 Tax=Aspergillus fumigatus (strain CBS 144.89 / FGSC A1163 / CEA10) TaxID=451804 RepID=B0Y9L0_ASPFC|nr:hypothetical protein AFUB_081410 [Aspergillus fumigatus A1163]
MGDLDTTAWDLFSKDPERLRVFLTGMKLLANFMPVTDAYGFTWVVESGYWGSQAHATAAICNEDPGVLKHRYILQDLPEVLDEVCIKDPEEIRGNQLMPVDFHQKQPVLRFTTSATVFMTLATKNVLVFSSELPMRRQTVDRSSWRMSSTICRAPNPSDGPGSMAIHSQSASRCFVLNSSIFTSKNTNSPP